MYFSRGNPVVYYGDEQGFTGPGGDQDARQTLFASQVPEYLDDDLLGTDATHATDNFDTGHPLYGKISELAALTAEHPALRDGAHQNRYASDGPGIYAFSRTDAKDQREYVVAVNNSETAQTAAVPTYIAKRTYSRIYGDAGVRSGSQDGRRRQAHRHRPAAFRGGLRIVRPDPALQGGSRRRAPGAGNGGRRQRQDPGGGRRRRFLVLRGHLPGADGGRRMGADRHGRHRPVPGVPRGHGAEPRHGRGIPRRGPRQRRAHLRERGPDRHRPLPCPRDAETGRGQQRGRQGGSQRHRQPGEVRLHGQLRAERRRRRLDCHRFGQFIAGLHRL